MRRSSPRAVAAKRKGTDVEAASGNHPKASRSDPLANKVAPAGVSPFDTVPSDILRLIVEFIPWRPRLLVVSLVSSRFNVICRQSITHLYCPSLRVIKAPLQMLPKITSMDMSWMLNLGAEDRAVKQNFARFYYIDFASLTSANVSSIAENFVSIALDRLPASLSELTVQYSDVKPYLPKFTALARLHIIIKLGWGPVGVIPAGQLDHVTELTVRCPVINGIVSFASLMPRLRRLHVPTTTPDVLIPFLHLLPALESLTAYVDADKSISELTERFNHLELQLRLSSLTWRVPGQTFTNLQSLSHLVSLHTEEHEIDYGSLTTLTRLVFAPGHELSSFTRTMPNLHVLRLPHVKAADMLEFVRSALLHCPVLRLLRVRFDHDMISVEVARNAIVAAAKHPSLEVLHFELPHRIYPLECQEIQNYARRFPWLCCHFVACGCHLCRRTVD